MYLEFIPIIITISLTIFMFFYSKELKRNEPIKQDKALNSVKENLKNIKNEFDEVTSSNTETEKSSLGI